MRSGSIFPLRAALLGARCIAFKAKGQETLHGTVSATRRAESLEDLKNQPKAPDISVNIQDKTP